MSIPNNNLVPGSYTEFDKSAALQGDPAKPHRVLLVGGVPAASAGPKLVPTAVGSEGEVLAKWGKSVLAGVAWGFFRANRRVRVDAIALPEPSAGQVAAATIEATGTATENGLIVVMINGVRIEVGIASGDATADIHDAIKDAIDDAVAKGPHQLPLEATIDSGAVKIAALQKGAIGNENTLSIEGAVEGVTLAVADFAGGLGNEDSGDAVAALGDVQYDTIVLGLPEGSWAPWQALMVERWGPMVQKDGMLFAAASGTHGSLTTLGDSLNWEYLALVGAGKSPTPSWVWAAQVAAGDTKDPDTPRPRFGMLLPDCAPPPAGEEFTAEERQLLLEAGVSTYRVTPGGSCIVERLITTYTVDEATGTPDPVFRNLSTMRNLAYLRWSWNALLERKYPDANIADDGVRVNPGVKVITPSVIRGEAISWFQRMEGAGRVEGFAAFKELLEVWRDADDVERMNVISPPDLVNELVTFATTLAFRL